MTADPFWSNTLKGKIYAEVFERIITGAYPADEFLNEARLAKEFGVSRAPVREALVALCNEKVLQTIPRTGYRIVSISPREVRDAIAVRQVLEREAASQALRNLDEGRLARVDAALEAEHAVEATTASVGQWMKQGESIHLMLAEFSGNQVLKEMIAELLMKLRRASTLVYFENSKSGLRNSIYHAKVLEALRRRDEAALLQNLERDINLSADLLRGP